MIPRHLRLFSTLLAVGAALLFAGAAYAQEDAPAGRGKHGKPSPEKIMKKFDKNQDGKLTADELPEKLAKRLMRADADGDGAVTQDELQTAGEKMKQRHGKPGERGKHGPPNADKLFERFDKNQDGQLSQDELPERMAARLMKADADGNGFLTKEELAEGLKKAVKRGQGKLFERFDKNQDGQLSQDELPQRIADRLMKADADGNGILTKEELAEGLKKLHGQRGHGHKKDADAPAE